MATDRLPLRQLIPPPVIPPDPTQHRRLLLLTQKILDHRQPDLGPPLDIALGHRCRRARLEPRQDERDARRPGELDVERAARGGRVRGGVEGMAGGEGGGGRGEANESAGLG